MISEKIYKKAVKAIKGLKKNQVCLSNDYFGENGTVCFNGAIYEAIYGKKDPNSPSNTVFILGSPSNIVFMLGNDLGGGAKCCINDIHYEYVCGNKSFTQAKNEVLKTLKAFKDNDDDF